MSATHFKRIIKPAYLLIPSLMVSPFAFGDDYPVVSGTFFMATVTSAPINLSPGNNTGVLTEGIFQGTPNTFNNHALFEPFDFFGFPVGSYTAENGVDTDGVPYVDALGNVTPDVSTDPHPAPSVDLVAGTADMSSFYAYWSGTEFNQGSSSAPVIDNFDGTYTISWQSLIVGGPFNGKTGSWVMTVTCPACPPSESGPAANLNATQNSVITRTVTIGDGLVNISTDLPSTTGYSFNWGDTNDALDAGNIDTTPTFTFDPSSVAVGSYNVTLKISNNNTTPVQKSITTFIIQVVASGTLADIGDSDNDGVDNTSDLIDNITTPTQIQGVSGNNTTYILESSAGSLTIGNVATCASTNSAEVTLNQIKNNAGTSCTATAKATDDTFSVTTGIGGYFDIQVRNLTRGEQVQVVIPLHAALPKNAGFRKFNNNQTPAWNPFDTTGADAVASASSTSTGVCPAPAATSWQSGLKQGNDCIRLSITDAGSNDTDGFSNGVITLTGTIEGYPGIDADLQEEGCSMTGNHSNINEHLEWIIVALFLFGLGLMNRSQTKSTATESTHHLLK